MKRRKLEEEPCPRLDLHTEGQPEGYLQWHNWAEKMSMTHRQRECPGCGKYEIWLPNPEPGS